jgi:phosphate transport system substrate-binding protein
MRRRVSQISIMTLMFLSSACEHPDAKGAGSSLAYPLYQDWIAHAGLRGQLAYESASSEVGINMRMKQQVDFAGSDWPLPAKATCAKSAAPEPNTLEYAAGVGGVAVVYNLRGFAGLRFTPEVLADIFDGKIKWWDDAAIKTDNPTQRLPQTPITVVYRSDGSGTTRVFTEFLASKSDKWRRWIDRTKDPFLFPTKTGVGAEGSDGVAQTVGGTDSKEGSIGYVEDYYAKVDYLTARAKAKLEARNKKASPEELAMDAYPLYLNVGFVKNESQEFQQPDPTTLSNAVPDDDGHLGRTAVQWECDIIDSNKSGAYPITALTWIILSDHPTDRAKPPLCKFLRHGLREGQVHAPAMGFGLLPDSLVKYDEQVIEKICPTNEAAP